MGVCDVTVWFVLTSCVEGQGNLRLYDQATRIISIGKLNTLLCLHTRPINDVVFIVPLGDLCPGRSHLEARFPLRCFQRLSLPNIATRLCHWRDNRNTRGSSTPVLSY